MTALGSSSNEHTAVKPVQYRKIFWTGIGLVAVGGTVYGTAYWLVYTAGSIRPAGSDSLANGLAFGGWALIFLGGALALLGAFLAREVRHRTTSGTAR